MGFRFRKSFKIAPGVRVNFGKKSTSISVGGKGFRKTYSSSGRTTTSIGIPGTGLSYSTSTGGSKRGSSKKSARRKTFPSVQQHAHSSVFQRDNYSAKTYKICGIALQVLSPLLFISGIVIALLYLWVGILTAAFAVLLFLAGRHCKAQAIVAAAQELSKRDELLALQKIVLEDSPEELIMPEWQLRATADEKARNSHRIMNDCSTILRTTVNPEVFFDRLQLLSTHCRVLADLEQYISFSGASPTDVLNTLVNEKQDIIREFLVRCFQSADAKADTLKTSRGKLNQYQRLYDSLIPYFAEMDTGNIDFVETTRQEKAKLLVEAT